MAEEVWGRDGRKEGGRRYEEEQERERVRRDGRVNDEWKERRNEGRKGEG